MPSLSTRAGTPSPKNVNFYDLKSKDFHYYTLKNSVLQGYYGTTRLHDDLLVRLYQGRVIENFHKRKNAGELLPMTKYAYLESHQLECYGRRQWGYSDPYTGDVYYSEFVPKYGTARSGPLFYGKSGIGGTGGYSPFDPVTLTAFDSEVNNAGIDPHYFVQAAASKLYSRGWDALTFLAELNKTLRLLKDAFDRAKRLLTEADQFFEQLKKRGRDVHRNSLLLQQWLEARYGWRLLLYDIQDISKTISDWDEKLLVRTKERTGYTKTLTEDRSYSVSGGAADFNYSDIREVEIGVRGSIIADFVPSRIALNPFVTGWEVVPYSFVIDWFFSIGKAIDAISFILVNDRYTASIGLYLNVTRTGLLDVAWKPNYSGDIQQSVSQSYTWKRRKPVTVPYLPFYANRFDWAKGIDALGLLDAFFSGMLRKWSIR